MKGVPNMFGMYQFLFTLIYLKLLTADTDHTELVLIDFIYRSCEANDQMEFFEVRVWTQYASYKYTHLTGYLLLQEILLSLEFVFFAIPFGYYFVGLGRELWEGRNNFRTHFKSTIIVTDSLSHICDKLISTCENCARLHSCTENFFIKQA